MPIIFENNLWFISKSKDGKSLLLVSKAGHGTAEAFLQGKPFQYDRQDIRNRGPRIVYKGVPVPSYLKAKVTAYFSRGARFR